MNPVLLRQTTDAFMSAAIDPSRWSSVLHDLATSVDAAGVALLPIKGRVPGVPLSDSVGGMFDDYFKDGWNVRDYREAGIPKMLRTGIMVDQDFTSPEMMRSNAYYEDLMRPHGLYWFAGVAFNADDDIWCAAIQRSPDQGPFTADEQRHLLSIRSGLSAAATLARRVGLARVEGWSSAFELMDKALFLLDRYGRVMFATSMAEGLLRRTLRMSGGEFVLPRSDEQARLRASVRRAVYGMTEYSPDANPIAVTRPDKPPLILHVMKLPEEIKAFFSPAIAMILVIDPNKNQEVDEGLLARIFDLTRAEARLASHVASGGSLETYAGEVGLAASTVQTMMKRILSKSGTHRQGEFVALGLRMAALQKKPR